MKHVKTIDELTIEDLQDFPIWEFTNSDEHVDETVVRPIRTFPVKGLANRLVATEVRLANGDDRWALIGNVTPTDARRTHHFLTLSVFDRGKAFTLARYHDFDAAKRGPKALARFLRLPVDSVFPISYDIRRYAVGEAAALQGVIGKVPEERLTRAQVIALAVG